MIKIEALSKSYQDGKQLTTVLDNLNLTIAPKQQIAITGESGSGKSTLLHLLACLDKPDTGSIIVNQQNICLFSSKASDAYRQKSIGIVFQKFNLIECLSVWENVCFPARLNQNLDEKYLLSLLEELGIAKQRHKMPMDLSGGEQQRVAIARALSHKPQLILADEPTGNLDDKNSDKVANLLLSLCSLHNAMLVMVTHSHKLAKQAHLHYHLSDKKLTLQAND
ncbi:MULTISPECIES: ABC transporter ATP-binding protein [Alteromonadaceae]|uniref:ABC transporter ATP-binding protein n=1 Tax=Alteromonadaceae TaxID=72275 RepID=UPI001C08C089|nr:MULTISPECIES: ABC transporter ATP-binding protein [Aliiglaciecola]MBU2879745.1 ABC transporter ATP-binding protein [Aliiglaciecola lipolytica]MDO6709976.1 ABC transporter ATP-binding protein [Aliiglaciecola sp. 2_MG-2023]MDO6751124.1 ABC transporter ATP-binding protein [Aliiglaciecola sp. 1_MG-2023]